MQDLENLLEQVNEDCPILEGTPIFVPLGILDDGLLYRIEVHGNLEKLTLSGVTPNCWIRLLINAHTRATFTSDSKGFAECTLDPVVRLDRSTQLEFEKMQSKVQYALTLNHSQSQS